MAFRLNDFINMHRGRDAIVFGLGTSVNDILGEDLSGFITIGVNDIDAVYSPKYLLTLDMTQRFSPKRLDNMKNTRADFMFTQDKSWKKVRELEGRVIEIKLGNRQLTNIDNPEVFDFSSNSPYVATLLAHRMGCSRIGIIGVDFTNHHVHIKDGEHELVRNGRLAEIDRDYSRLVSALKKRGSSVFNLSESSLLESIPKMTIKKFLSKT